MEPILPATPVWTGATILPESSTALAFKLIHPEITLKLPLRQTQVGSTDPLGVGDLLYSITFNVFSLQGKLNLDLASYQWPYSPC